MGKEKDVGKVVWQFQLDIKDSCENFESTKMDYLVLMEPGAEPCCTPYHCRDHPHCRNCVKGGLIRNRYASKCTEGVQPSEKEKSRARHMTWSIAMLLILFVV